MPVNASVVNILNSARKTGAATSAVLPQLPVRTGDRGIGSERFSAAKRVILHTQRLRDGTTGALDGTLAIYGADLSNSQTFLPVLGNAFAAVPLATAVRPQIDQIIGDGSTTVFTTNVDLASADLASAIAGITNASLVELPMFRLAQDSTLAAITGTMVAGVITTSAAFDTAIKGGVLAAGDTLSIANIQATVVSASGSTITTDSTLSVSVASPVYITTPRRQFLQVVAAGAGVASNDVEATVTGSKLVLTFKVAPPAMGPYQQTNPTFIARGGIAETRTGATHLVTPTQLLADGANEFNHVGVRSRSAVWAILTATAGGNVSATNALLEISPAL